MVAQTYKKPVHLRVSSHLPVEIWILVANLSVNKWTGAPADVFIKYDVVYCLSVHGLFSNDFFFLHPACAGEFFAPPLATDVVTLFCTVS